MSEGPGGKNLPQPNRTGSPRANHVSGTNNGSSAALKGATLAFAARSRRLSGGSDSREAESIPRARKAAVIAGSRGGGGGGGGDHSQIRPLPHHEDPSTSSVRDRIKQFSSEDAESRPLHISQRLTDPQHVAAQLAVGRSTGHGPSHPLTKRSGDVRGQSLTLLYPNQDSDSESHMRPGINQSTAGAEKNLSICSHSSSSTSMAMQSPANSRQEEPTEQGLPRPERVPLSGGSKSKPIPPPRSAPSTAKNTGGALPAEGSTRLPSVHAQNNGVVASRQAPSQSPPHQSQSNTHEDAAVISKQSLADAKTASFLASSRASSPSKQTPPLPPPQRRPTTRSFLQPAARRSMEDDRSRTPSPSKGLRQTMREETKYDDEDAERMRNKKNPRHRERIMRHNNEANRKRCRGRITDRERKRYEGVWAANKGLLLESDDTQLQNTVVNVVVRNIWTRSRLAPALLGQIWDLVARDSSVMVLSREEFVVGLWLIDQSLQGRKLPWKVPQTVWESVQQVQLSGLKQ